MKKVPGVVRRVPRWMIVASWIICTIGTGVIMIYVIPFRWILSGFFMGSFWARLFLDMDREAERTAEFDRKVQEELSLIGKCNQQFYACICAEPLNHTTPHRCKCGGSWIGVQGAGNIQILRWPSWSQPS